MILINRALKFIAAGTLAILLVAGALGGTREASAGYDWFQEYLKYQERERIKEQQVAIHEIREALSEIRKELDEIIKERSETTDPEKLEELNMRQDDLKIRIQWVSEKMKKLRIGSNK